jgi:spermidine/putrescine transport system permease protein
VFWRITFPLLLPGILAAALLSFSLSFDDFIITYFNSGSVQTFPTYIYTAATRGIPAQANVIASAVFLLAIAIVLTTQIASESRRKRLVRATEAV